MKDFPSLDETSAVSYLEPPAGCQSFAAFVLDFYDRYGRKFPWRETDDVYRVLLSEMMLQQTQTGRVLEKYQEFLTLWPTLEDLAQAPFDQLLDHWRGLGYNRRALNLKRCAQASEAYGYTLPCDEKALLALPGIGPSTAAAIIAFSYHKPAIYLETNIRRVLLFAFHPEEEAVEDRILRDDLKRLLPLAGDGKRWYYALMDYGVLLKHLVPNPNARSKGYHRQSRFEGSNRQVRGMLVHALSESGARDIQALYGMLPFEPERIDKALSDLVRDGLVSRLGRLYRISR